MSDIPPHMIKRAEMGKVMIQSLADGPTEVIVQSLEQGKAAFLAELDSLSVEQIEFKPAEDRWSIQEIALHVSHAMRHVGELSLLLGEGQFREKQPILEAGLSDEKPRDWGEILDLVNQSFDVSLGAARKLDTLSTPDDLLDHPWFGPLNNRQWAAFNIIHCMVHVAQITKNKEAEGYPS